MSLWQDKPRTTLGRYIGIWMNETDVAAMMAGNGYGLGIRRLGACSGGNKLRWHFVHVCCKKRNMVLVLQLYCWDNYSDKPQSRRRMKAGRGLWGFSDILQHMIGDVCKQSWRWLLSSIINGLLFDVQLWFAGMYFAPSSAGCGLFSLLYSSMEVSQQSYGKAADSWNIQVEGCLGSYADSATEPWGIVNKNSKFSYECRNLEHRMNDTSISWKVSTSIEV